MKKILILTLTLLTIFSNFTSINAAQEVEKNVSENKIVDQVEPSTESSKPIDENKTEEVNKKIETPKTKEVVKKVEPRTASIKLTAVKNLYGYVKVNNRKVYSDLNTMKVKYPDTKKIYKRTYTIKNYAIKNNVKYYSLYTNNALIGYVDQYTLTTTSNPYGIKMNGSGYASLIVNNAKVYSSIRTFETKDINLRYQTFKNECFYNHSNGKRYYGLRDHNDKWIGYVESKDLKLTTSEKGNVRHYGSNQYATIKEEGWRIWENIAPFENVVCKTTGMLDKTYLIGDVYYHYNGNTYYQLIDSKNNILGFINRDACKVSQKGFKHKQNNYVSINTNNAIIYDCLDTMHQSKTSKDYYLKTVENSGYYQFPNGDKYYSIYDNNDKWIGYIKSDYVSESDKACGINRKYSTPHYATLKKEDYTIWGSLDPFEDKRSNTSDSNRLNHTYKIANVYYHFNGNKYLSLRDEDDKWIGYVNENASVISENSKGKATSSSSYCTISKDDYKVWTDIDNFDNYVMKTSSIYKQSFRVKYVYYHSNGSKYFSLYDEDDNWVGYINANASKELVYFSQHDDRFNKQKVPKVDDYISSLGCGPTSTAMSLCYFNNNSNYTDPMQIATKFVQTGLLSEYGLLIDKSLMVSSLNEVGLNAKYISSSESSIKSALNKGHHLLLDGKGSNPFTFAGHFILACGINKEGNVLILDPNNEDNNGWWSIDTLKTRGYHLFDVIEIYK